jgi:hypothetical protein
MTVRPVVPEPRVPAGESAGSWSQWFGIFGASVAWALQELVGYGLTADPCGAGPGAAGAVGTSLVASVALTLVGAGALFVAIQSRRRSVNAREHFMAQAGILVSGLFLAGLLANLAVLLLVPACAPAAG